MLNSRVLEYFLKSVTNLSRQIVQEGQKTETQLLQKIGRNSDLLHRTRIEYKMLFVMKMAFNLEIDASKL